MLELCPDKSLFSGGNTMTEYSIHTSKLTKRYHQKPAVNQLNLAVPKGAIYGFLGPNGAGKSTTMKMLLGLIRKDEGSISINGMEMNEKNRVSILADTGSLIENPSYYANLTARENLQISCMLRRLPETEISRVLSIVRLSGQEKKKTSHYSLGMKQRLGLANALLGSPSLVMLDEPTNGLDPAGIHEMRELIKDLPKKYGMTVMISSHLLSEIEQTADYIGIISQGNLIFQDSLSLLQARSRRNIWLKTGDDPAARTLISQQFSQDAFLHAQKTSDTVHHGQGILLPWMPDAQLAALVRKLTEKEIELYRIEEICQNLEDIYLDMVKEAGL